MQVGYELLGLLLSANSFFQNNRLGHYYFSASYFIVFIVPLMDRCIYPALGAYAPSMLQMIGIGFVILIIVVIILAVITAVDILLHVAFIGLCLFVYSIGEVLSVIPGEQIIYGVNLI